MRVPVFDVRLFLLSRQVNRSQVGTDLSVTTCSGILKIWYIFSRCSFFSCLRTSKMFCCSCGRLSSSTINNRNHSSTVFHAEYVTYSSRTVSRIDEFWRFLCQITLNLYNFFTQPRGNDYLFDLVITSDKENRIFLQESKLKFKWKIDKLF